MAEEAGAGAGEQGAVKGRGAWGVARRWVGATPGPEGEEGETGYVWLRCGAPLLLPTVQVCTECSMVECTKRRAELNSQLKKPINGARSYGTVKVDLLHRCA